jgi:hypothetical protein
LSRNILQSNSFVIEASMKQMETKFGKDLLEALKEVLAHRRGEIELNTHIYDEALGRLVRADGWYSGEKAKD